MKLRILSSLVLAVLFSAVCAQADATYVYSGKLMTGGCPILGCSATGNLDVTVTLVAPLGDDFSGFVTPLSFSGVVVAHDSLGNIGDAFGNIAAATFEFSTDANGNIVGWDVTAFGSDAGITTSTNSDGAFDVNNFFSAFSLSNSNDPGTWTEIPTPEPSSLPLLGTGLLGIGLFLRRRFLSA